MKKALKRAISLFLCLLLTASLLPLKTAAWADFEEEETGTETEYVETVGADEAAAEPATFTFEAPDETAEEPAEEASESAADISEEETAEPAEEPEEDPAEETAEEPEEESEEEPEEEGALEYRVLEQGNVTVSGMIPAEAYLCVTEINPENYVELVGKGRAVAFAYDICLILDGCEWQPVEALSVEIRDYEIAGLDMEILHLADNAVTPELVAETSADAADGSVEFAAESFSVYIGTTSSPRVMLKSSEQYTFYADPECKVKIGEDLIIENDSSLSVEIYIRANEGCEIKSVSVKNSNNSASPAAVTAGTGDDEYDFRISFPGNLVRDQIITVTMVSHTTYWIVYDDSGVTTLFISSLPIDADNYEAPLKTGTGTNWTNSGYRPTIAAVKVGDAATGDIVRPNTLQSWFASYTALTSVDLSGLDTSNVTSLSSTFFSCTKLTGVDVSGWDTSKVTSMSQTFRNCGALTDVDVSGWNTSKVTEMAQLFSGCPALTGADVSGWDTSSVKSMSGMFSGCKNLTYLNVSGWDTSNVTNMSGMFGNCDALAELDVSGWDTSKVTTVGSMFNSCKSLTELDVSGWDTSMVTEMSSTFLSCSKLAALDLSGWDTSKVKTMQSMFQNCGALTSLDLRSFDTSNVTSMANMFYNCYALAYLDVSSFNTSKVTTFGSTFQNCNALETLDVSGWDTSNVTTMASMFNSCKVLAALDVSGFDTSKVTNMGNMFNSCSKVAELDVSGFDTSKVTTMIGMFNSCTALAELDVSGFDTSKVTSMQNMFNGCVNLPALDVSGFDTANVTSMQSMFTSCKKLEVIDVSGFNTSKVTAMGSMFANCIAVAELDVSGFDTSNVTSTASMFSSCNKVAELDVSGWDTSKVTNMSSMFAYCYSISYFDVSGWDTSKVTNMYGVFSNCSKLVFLDVSGFDTSKVTDMGYMFQNCNKLNGLDVSGWDTSNVKTLGSMFQGCYALEYLDVSGWNTSNNTSLAYTFYYCRNLTELDVSGFNTSKVTTTTYTFCTCEKVTELDVSGWDTSSVTNSSYMFSGCNLITYLDVSGWDTSKMIYMTGTFANCPRLAYLDVSGFNTSKVATMNTLFGNCKSLTELDLSSFDMRNVGSPSGFFTNCENLVRVTVGELSAAKVSELAAIQFRNQKWYDADGTEYSAIPTDRPGTYYKSGKQVPEYCMTLFNANTDDTVTGMLKLSYGATIDLGTIFPKRANHSLTGWNTEADGSGTAYGIHDTYTAVPGTTTLYAIWSAERITVSYSGNGGTDSEGSDIRDTITGAGESFIIAGNCFTREGFSFSCWQDADENSYNPGALTSFTEDTVLTAVWTELPGKVTVTFSANGGNEESVVESYEYNRAYILKKPSFTRSGYGLAGWSLNEDCGPEDAELIPFGTRMSFTADTVIYAVWHANPTFTFHSNSDTDVLQSMCPTWGEKASLGNVSFTRPGLVLSGWNTEADGSGTDYSGRAYITALESLELYARWTEAAYTVVFDKNSPEAEGRMARQTMFCGTEYTLNPLTFTRTGYAFDGWDDGNGHIYSDGAAVQDLALEQGAVITLKAIWVPVPSYQVVIPAAVEITASAGSASGDSGEMYLKATLANFGEGDTVSVSVQYSGLLSFCVGGEVKDSIGYTLYNGSDDLSKDGGTVREFSYDSTDSGIIIMALRASINDDEAPRYAGTYTATATFSLDVVNG